MTGPETGTYYQIGQEASLVTDPSGVHLQVLPSKGSWENIVALFNSDTEFAIFQIDAFARAAENLYRNTGVSIHEDIHVVMPLFSEEVHVIKAREKDFDFAKQQSFIVGCGPESGGSCLTAAVIEDVYDKQFSYTYRDYETALDELRNGVIDLVIVTAGTPYPLLVEQTGLDLVALPRFNKASKFYSWTSLGPEDYAWLQRDVEVFAVRSVLATMIQEEEGLANDLVSSVHYSLLGNEDKLKKTGHPKWNDVQFTGYIKDFSHAGALRSLGVCKAIADFGYSCSDMVSGKE
jgi:TRAP-type uncharacterized transport system substrate-binding protein